MPVARFRPALSLREAARFLTAGFEGRQTLPREFERAFGREVLGGQTVVLAPSGRVALYWLLKALDVSRGDEVIVQAFNFTAVPAAVEAAGATPRFVDLAPDTFEIDARALAEAITPRTRAVLITHLYGNPADIDGVKAVCDERAVPLLEDCAQAVGASYRGRPLGTFGQGTLFTFGPTKNFTLFGGGAAASSDPVMARRIGELARRHGRVGRLGALRLAAKAGVISVATSRTVFDLGVFPAIRLLSLGGHDPVHEVMAEPDSPLRQVERYPVPSASMASVGLAQLDRYEELNRARERNGWSLHERLGGIDGIVVPAAREGNIFLSFPVFHPRREAFAAQLRRRGVDTDLGFMCDCSAHPMFSAAARDCPQARRAASEIVHLPVHADLRGRDLDRIVAAVKEAIEVVG